MKPLTRIFYVVSNLLFIGALIVLIYRGSSGEVESSELELVLFTCSCALALFYCAIKRGFFYGHFDDYVGGSYKTGSHYTVTYSSSTNTATVKEESEYSGGGYNWLWNLILLVYHSSMVIFFGSILAIFDNEKMRARKERMSDLPRALEIIGKIFLYYFYFLVVCCGLGLFMYLTEFIYLGLLLIASIILRIVVARVGK